MKKLLSILLTLSLLLALTTFSGAAIPAQVDHAAHDLQGTCRSVESPMTGDYCENCGELGLYYRCGGEHRTDDTGTHTYGLTFKTCSIRYTTSSTKTVCRSCGYSEIITWHPICDEYHSACGLGWYRTCSI